MSRTENMVVVIQCAGGKRADAGHMKDDAGRKVLFVADPASAPQSDSGIYKRPDDAASSGRSYRDVLEDYNRNQRADNPLGLLPAWELYTDPAYQELADRFGVDNLYILSAGWGLVKAEYLLPKYDITFSASAKGENAYKRRRRGDCGYCDFAMLPATTSKHVVFLGGKAYVPLFRRLTDGVARRTVVFYSKTPPRVPEPEYEHYWSAIPRNRHYECAKKLVSGEFTVR